MMLLGHLHKVVPFFWIILCSFSVNAKLVEGQSFTLPNGLQVVVIPNHKAPVVSCALWVKAGTKDDPPGRSGIAHFLEHLMLKGASLTMAEDTVMKEMDVLGAEHNAATGFDLTVYYQRLPRHHLPRAMSLIAPRLQGLRLTLPIVTSERKVILEERSMRTDNIPEKQLLEGIFASLYWNHPYGRPTIGWRHEMESLSLEDAQAFYTQFYTPQRMILVLAGDITLKDARNLVDQYYASLVPQEDISLAPLVEPPHHGLKTHLVNCHARIKKRSCYYAFLLDMGKHETISFKDAVGLELLDYLLSHDTLGYAYEYFVREKEIATHVSIAMMSPTKLQPAVLCSVSPKEKITREAIAHAWDMFFEELPSKIKAENIEEAKRRLLRAQRLKSDSAFYGAEELGSAMVLGYSFEEANAWPEVLQALTIEDIQALAQTFVRSRHAVVTAEALPCEEGPSISREPRQNKPLPAFVPVGTLVKGLTQ
ncbi:MAG: insulinase family protein [Alphaproteobacteria bacterium]|nr:MAG: insulinase family protein [Alphaproteobacteria bacterium]